MGMRTTVTVSLDAELVQWMRLNGISPSSTFDIAMAALRENEAKSLYEVFSELKGHLIRNARIERDLKDWQQCEKDERVKKNIGKVLEL